MDKNSEFVFVADIGGTNTRLAIAKNRKLKLVIILKTKKLKSIIPSIKKILRGTNIKNACIATAGPVKNNTCKLTNANLTINAKEIIKKTSLEKVTIINDFEAVAYGIEALKKSDLIILKKGKAGETKLVIGAGTGLGTSLVRNCKVLPTEEGHLKFTPKMKQEKELAKFINKKTLTYEDLVSGRGLEKIYTFLSNKKLTAEKISENKKKDKFCKEAFRIFTKFYADFATKIISKTKASELYIAGGIAPKNKEILKTKTFLDNTPNIPIFLIKNENVGLLGASFKT